MSALMAWIPGGIFLVLGVAVLVGRKPLSHYRGVMSIREAGMALPMLLGIWFIVLGLVFLVVGVVHG